MTAAFRIACALALLAIAFVVILPADPTLLGGEGERAAIVAAPIEASDAGGVRPAPSPAPVRPAPPVEVQEAAPAEAPETVLPDAPGREAALAPEEAEDVAPEYRLFARPVAVDSATLRIGETTVRIAGVAPVAPEARCADGALSWPCGARARTALRGWLRGRSVLCRIPAREADARELTVPCLLGEEDVGAWLVRNGWATASAGSRYAEDEARARDARIGVWSPRQPN